MLSLTRLIERVLNNHCSTLIIRLFNKSNRIIGTDNFLKALQRKTSGGGCVGVQERLARARVNIKKLRNNI